MKHVRSIFAFAGVALVLFGCRGTGDRLELPTPPRDDFESLHLSCIHATSVDHVVIGGFLDRADGGVEGVVLRTLNGGRTWRRVGSETHEFEGLIVQNVNFNDRLLGWISGIRIDAEGTSAVVLRTETDGKNWSEVVIAEPRANLILATRDLEFVTDDVGTVDIVFEDEGTGDVLSNVYRSQDSGRTWLIDAFKEAVDDQMVDQGVVFFSVDQGYKLEDHAVDGVQRLMFSATSGRTWREVARFHVSQWPEFYGPLDERAGQ